MAYKFQRGAAVASGSFTAENGLTSSNGLSVTVGTSTLQAVNAQGVTATTLSASGGLQVGSSATIASGLTITGLGATITGSVAVSGSITSTGNITVTAGVLSASNAVQTAGNVVAGSRVQGQTLTASLGSTLAATIVTTLTGSGLAQFESLTVNGGGAATLSNAVITGGTINGTTIGATTPSSVQATTLSGSGNLEVGGTATVAGITTLNNALTVSAGGVAVSAGGLSVNSGDSSVQKLTVNGDLIVLGTTISASVQNLIIEDKQIVLADGAASAAAAAGAGFFVSGANVEWTYKQNGEGTAASSGDIFVASGSSGLKSIQASSFYGTFVGTMASPVTLIADAGTLAIGVNYFADVAGASSVTLPAAPSVGESVRVKAPSNCNTTNTITVNRTGSQTIDAETFIVLESPFAAVEFVYVATNLWRIF